MPSPNSGRKEKKRKKEKKKKTLAAICFYQVPPNECQDHTLIRLGFKPHPSGSLFTNDPIVWHYAVWVMNTTAT